MTGFSAAERAALDRVTVPAMRAGLARDIVAAASAGVVPPRRSARGGWRRHGRLLIGAGALVVASATAAATGLLDRLPIHIPGITRAVEAPVPKPKHVARVEKPRVAAGEAVSVAAIPVPTVPLVDPTPIPGELLRERRAARIAAGLPVRPTLMQRAMAERLRALPPDQRRAAIAEWRRIKALPPAERKLAVAKVRADYLAAHPKMAARFEQRLEAKSAAAATGPGDARPVPPPVAAPPTGTPRVDAPPAGLLAGRPRVTGPPTAEDRMRRRQWVQSLTPEQREQLRAWRQQRRAQGLGGAGNGARMNGQGMKAPRWRRGGNGGEGSPATVR